MLESLHARVCAVSDDFSSAELALGPVTVRAGVPSNLGHTLSEAVGQDITVYTLLRWPEGGGEAQLLAFATSADRATASALLAQPGIGPKLVLSLLGHCGGPGLRRALHEGNQAVLAAVPGMGAKSAARLVLACASKPFPLGPTAEEMAQTASEPATVHRSRSTAAHSAGPSDPVSVALTGLGWSATAAAEQVRTLRATHPEAPESDLLRLALTATRPVK
jgi:holliday junction DNA helicase RuvA